MLNDTFYIIKIDITLADFDFGAFKSVSLGWHSFPVVCCYRTCFIILGCGRDFLPVRNHIRFSSSKKCFSLVDLVIKKKDPLSLYCSKASFLLRNDHPVNILWLFSISLDYIELSISLHLSFRLQYCLHSLMTSTLFLFFICRLRLVNRHHWRESTCASPVLSWIDSHIARTGGNWFIRRRHWQNWTYKSLQLSGTDRSIVTTDGLRQILFQDRSGLIMILPVSSRGTETPTPTRF